MTELLSRTGYDDVHDSGAEQDDDDDDGYCCCCSASAESVLVLVLVESLTSVAICFAWAGKRLKRVTKREQRASRKGEGRRRRRMNKRSRGEKREEDFRVNFHLLVQVAPGLLVDFGFGFGFSLEKRSSLRFRLAKQSQAEFL